MKRVLLTILLLATICVVQANDIQISIKPNPVIAGSPAQLVISAASKDIPKIQQAFPTVNHIQWLNGSSSRMYRVNGRITSSIAYSFVATETGSYTIPAFNVNINGGRALTSPVSFKVIGAGTVKATAADGSKRPLKDMLFAKAVILSEGRDFYVGEEVPIEIRLYLMRGLNANPTAWPQFNVDNIIFRNYKNNQQDKRFAQPTQTTENINGRIFNVLKFRTAFRPIVAGKLDLAARIACEVQVPDQRRRSRSWFDDDFFSGRSRRRLKQTVNAAFPEINIKPLPPVPENVLSLGLVGNWYVDFAVIGDEFKVGEPFTLKIEIKGMGTLETLTAPRLKIPGFRIYRPEVDKGLVTAVGSSKAVVKYVIIPTKSGEKKLNLSFSIFSCPKEKYEIFKCDEQLKIAKADNPSVTNGGIYIDSGSQQSDESYKPAAKTPRPAPGLHYQKRSLTGTVELPLYLNYFWLYLIVGLGGPLLLIFVESRQRHRQKLISDPLLQRKLKAQSERGRVIKAINAATDDEIDNAINQTAVPYLNALLGLPPGTTASELADKVKSPELAKCLKSTGHSSYMPGGDSMNKTELKKTLLKILRKMSVVALFFVLSLNTFATETENRPIKTAVPVAIASDSQALTAYDNGDFRQTAEYYYNQLEHQAPDPALLYNLGNCFSRLEDYPRAAVCYERARLLAPSDNDILENLNYVRRKLFLPQLGKSSNPMELIVNVRNHLRPDQWLALAGVVWFIIFAAIAFRRRYSRAKFISLLLFSTLTLGLIAVAAISQYYSSYSSNQAIIISKMAKLYSLPSVKNAREISRVSGGTPVKILERRIDWIYIRHDNCEGWIAAKSLATTAPGTKLFSLPWKEPK
ncbi:MAG: BatD family protein [Victivallaceae bacterium]|nr:BatD family protein [Victivallaceae bacterium]